MSFSYRYLWFKTFSFIFITCLASTVWAGPKPVQTYYISLPEADVLTALEAVRSPSICSDGFAMPVNPITTYSAIVVSLDGGIIYYDHFEDGYEPDIDTPVQASTEIWGDGNSTNGFPPGDPADILSAGEVIILTATIDTTSPAAADFDAGDKIGSTVPITFSRSAWAAGTQTLLAGAVEQLSTLSWGTSYTVPVGEDTVGGTDDLFEVVGASITAAKNGTLVTVDKDGPGGSPADAAVPLNEGQAYLVTSGLQMGATITSNQPIEVVLLTGDECEAWESRWYRLVKDSDYGSSYYSPTGTTSAESTAVYLFNPSTSSSISVHWETSLGAGGSSPVTVPARGVSTVTVPDNQGARFYTTGATPATFAGVAALEVRPTGYNGSHDWGFTLVPEGQLRQQVQVGLGLGKDPTKVTPGNHSPVWLTADYPTGSMSSGSIDVCVDYNGDKSGPLSSGGIAHDVLLTVSPLTSTKILDPDGDQSGTFLWVCDGSDAIIATTWGQDPEGSTPTGSPALDAGTTVPAFPDAVALKDGILADDVGGDGQFDIGDTIEYTIRIDQAGNLPVPAGAFSVSDLLPLSEVSYVPGTSFYSPPSGPTVAVADDSGAGQTAFPFDTNPAAYSIPDVIPVGGSVSLIYRVIINAQPASGTILNKATLNGPGGEIQLQTDFEVIIGAKIGDTIFIDTNGNGTFNAGEGVTGVTITLFQGTNVYATTTSGTDGFYEFRNLTAGTYTVQVDASNFNAGGALVDTDLIFDPNGGDDNQSTVTLVQNEERLDQDFGYRAVGEIGDKIFHDLNNNGTFNAGEGINGVTVQLINSSMVVIDTEVTSGAGDYLFSDIPLGSYTVQVAASNFSMGAALENYTLTTDPEGALDNMSSATVTRGSSSLDEDFGYQLTANLGSIGDDIFIDYDENGMPGGSGEGVSGVVVNLLNSSATQIDSTTTSGSGKYLFSNLPAGIYTVEVDSSSLGMGGALEGRTNSVDPDGGSAHEVTLTLGTNQDRTDIDIGYASFGDIGDTIFDDLDGDGNFDSGEGISGVSVQLLNSMNMVIDTDTTGSSGDYLFTDYPPGTYTVVVASSNFLAGGALNNATNTVDPDTGTSNQASFTHTTSDNLIQDFGYEFPASVGDIVFHDANQNGSFDMGEGVNGVTVRLLDSSGMQLSTMVTASGGMYLFSGLDPDDYTIEIASTNFNMGGPFFNAIASVDPDGGNDNEADTTLNSGENDLTQDFGYVFRADIGDTIYEDVNENGAFNTGEGINGVTVELRNGSGVLITTTMTSGDGAYLFANLAPSNYQIVIPASNFAAMGALEDAFQTIDPDSSIDNRSSLTLASNIDNLAQDFGFLYEGSIGDTIFEDVNQNGTPEMGEGIQNVTVELRDQGGNFITSTTTDSAGAIPFRQPFP